MISQGSMVQINAPSTIYHGDYGKVLYTTDSGNVGSGLNGGDIEFVVSVSLSKHVVVNVTFEEHQLIERLSVPLDIRAKV